MVYVDDRTGSKELLLLLQDLQGRKGAKIKRLEYEDPDDPDKTIQAGDFAFMGHGPDGHCLVGIERKRVTDMIGSIESGRLSGSQLPNMLKVYQFNYLIVEGYYRPNPDNACIELPAGKGKWRDTIWRNKTMHYLAMDSFLNTIRMKSLVQVIKTRTPQETAMEIHILHHWFNGKEWDKHKSHLAFPYVQSYVAQESKPSLTRRWAKELDNIGWERSRDVERLFKTPHGLANGSVEKFALIDGITPDRANKIVKELRGLK